MMENMSQARMDAFAKLKMLRKVIAGVSAEDPELQVVDGMLSQLQSQTYTVAVVGEFNRGKSSLINALLGMPVLPADVTPTTAAINRVVYADNPEVRLHMKNGTVEDIPLGMLKSRVTKLNEEAQTEAERVAEAVIGYPTPFCRGGIALLDTPGLNESDAMSELTLQTARQADALLYALHALYPFSVSEARSVWALLRHSSVRHVLFTVGFMDMAPQESRERVLELCRKRIPLMTGELIDADDELTADEKAAMKAMLASAAVVGVSAKQALDAFVNGSMEELQASGIEVYKTDLMARLTARQDDYLQQTVLPYLHDTAGLFEQASDRAAKRMETRVAQGKTEMETANAALSSFLSDEPWNAWRRQVTAYLYDPERARMLTGILAADQPEELPSLDQSKQPTNKLLRWVKQKAESKGVYREADSPQVRNLQNAARNAQAFAMLTYTPVLNELAQTELHTRLISLDEAYLQARQAYAAALAAIAPNDAPALLEAMSTDDTVELLDASALERIEALPMLPSFALVGSVDSVIRRGVKGFLDGFAKLIDEQLDATAQPIRERIGTLGAALREQLDVLARKHEELIAESKSLAQQTAVLQSILFGGENNEAKQQQACL